MLNGVGCHFIVFVQVIFTKTLQLQPTSLCYKITTHTIRHMMHFIAEGNHQKEDERSEQSVGIIFDIQINFTLQKTWRSHAEIKTRVRSGE
jgi:hypothetical protein